MSYLQGLSSLRKAQDIGCPSRISATRKLLSPVLLVAFSARSRTSNFHAHAIQDIGRGEPAAADWPPGDWGNASTTNQTCYNWQLSADLKQPRHQYTPREAASSLFEVHPSDVDYDETDTRASSWRRSG
eukprot:m.149811 g.149811  ORF g.149811 m.149811 type:complete len:129 (+) comp52785_c3_seq8:116-502(+)